MIAAEQTTGSTAEHDCLNDPAAEFPQLPGDPGALHTCCCDQVWQLRKEGNGSVVWRRTPVGLNWKAHIVPHSA